MQNWLEWLITGALCQKSSLLRLRVVLKSCLRSVKGNLRSVYTSNEWKLCRTTSSDQVRVARRYSLKPKIQIWVNFGGPWNRKFWYISWPFEIYQSHLVYFRTLENLVLIWYIFPRFWYIVWRKIWQPWTKLEAILSVVAHDTKR
jgi:hypothetical protein